MKGDYERDFFLSVLYPIFKVTYTERYRKMYQSYKKFRLGNTAHQRHYYLAHILFNRDDNFFLEGGCKILPVCQHFR